MNPYEIKIYYIDLKTKQNGEIMPGNIPLVFRWESYYDISIPKNKLKNILDDEFIKQPMNIISVKIAGKLYFIVTIYDNKDDKVEYYVINKK